MALEILQDYFVVSVERIYEDAPTKSGIITLNAAWIEDGERDRNQYKRIYGTVIGVPQCYTGNPYRAIDDGMPAYRKFIGHDDIISRVNQGYNKPHDLKMYYPSTFDKYDVITMEKYAKDVNVKVGERVYFRPEVTEEVNHLGKENGQNLFRVPVTDIICSLVEVDWDSEGAATEYDVLTQGENVLVRPITETWEEITTPTGIIMKSAPEKKALKGVVCYTRGDWANAGGTIQAHLRSGMNIMFLPHSECEVKIEGEVYYVIPVQDIMGQLTEQ